MAERRRSSRERRRSEAEWRQIISRRDASGLSVREFCKREGLSLSSFQRWRARCRAALASPFVELVPPATPSEETQQSAPEWNVELELPGGLRLRLRA